MITQHIYLVLAYGIRDPGDMQDTRVPVACYSSEKAAIEAVQKAESDTEFSEFNESFLFHLRGYSVELIPFFEHGNRNALLRLNQGITEVS